MTGPAAAGTQGGPARRPARGRVLAVSAAALVVAVLAGTAIALAGGGGNSGPRAGAQQARPQPASRARPATPVTPAQDRPGPVLLVPGYGGSTGALDQLAASIRAAGRKATVLHLAGSGTGSLVPDAARLNAAVTRALARGAPSVDVIGYSAGGVVALLWARDYDGAARARRIITLGSPFHGTELAAAAEAIAPGECPAACRQLVPGSALLNGLKVTSPVGLPRWLSLWSTGDLVVMPADSARLAGAINVPVQSVCPAEVITHSQLPVNPVVVTMVLRSIGRGPLRAPSPAVCPHQG
jgi:triacylglycerol lipase